MKSHLNQSAQSALENIDSNMQQIEATNNIISNLESQLSSLYNSNVHQNSHPQLQQLLQKPKVPVGTNSLSNESSEDYEAQLKRIKDKYRLTSQQSDSLATRQSTMNANAQTFTIPDFDKPISISNGITSQLTHPTTSSAITTSNTAFKPTTQNVIANPKATAQNDFYLQNEYASSLAKRGTTALESIQQQRRQSDSASSFTHQKMLFPGEEQQNRRVQDLPLPPKKDFEQRKISSCGCQNESNVAQLSSEILRLQATISELQFENKSLTTENISLKSQLHDTNALTYKNEQFKKQNILQGEKDDGSVTRVIPNGNCANNWDDRFKGNFTMELRTSEAKRWEAAAVEDTFEEHPSLAFADPFRVEQAFNNNLKLANEDSEINALYQRIFTNPKQQEHQQFPSSTMHNPPHFPSGSGANASLSSNHAKGLRNPYQLNEAQKQLYRIEEGLNRLQESEEGTLQDDEKPPQQDDSLNEDTTSVELFPSKYPIMNKENVRNPQQSRQQPPPCAPVSTKAAQNERMHHLNSIRPKNDLASIPNSSKSVRKSGTNAPDVKKQQASTPVSSSGVRKHTRESSREHSREPTNNNNNSSNSNQKEMFGSARKPLKQQSQQQQQQQQQMQQQYQQRYSEDPQKSKVVQPKKKVVISSQEKLSSFTKLQDHQVQGQATTPAATKKKSSMQQSSKKLVTAPLAPPNRSHSANRLYKN